MTNRIHKHPMFEIDQQRDLLKVKEYILVFQSITLFIRSLKINSLINECRKIENKKSPFEERFKSYGFKRYGGV